MSRSFVIKQIIERERRGQTLAQEVVSQEAAELYNTACDSFGTWETALRYAGVRPKQAERQATFTAEMVIERLQQLAAEGTRMTSPVIINLERPLYKAARRHFGTWRAAIEAANLPTHVLSPATIPRRHLSHDEILAAIHERNSKGLSIRIVDVMTEDRDLALSAIRTFRNWGRAVAKAGLGVIRERPPSRWNQEKVIQGILDRLRKQQPCNIAAMKRDDGRLHNAGRRYFGSWRAAYQAALEAEARLQWKEQKKS